MSEHPAVAFLLAAHQRAEGLARAGTPGPWEPEGDDPTDDEVFTVHDGEHGDLVGGTVAFVRDGMWGRPAVETAGRVQANMQLIASFANPTAVLRRVAAERKLLTDLQSERHLVVDGDGWYTCAAATEERDGDECYDEGRRGGDCDCGRDDRVERRVLLLAEAWGWTAET